MKKNGFWRKTFEKTDYYARTENNTKIKTFQKPPRGPRGGKCKKKCFRAVSLKSPPLAQPTSAFSGKTLKNREVFRLWRTGLWKWTSTCWLVLPSWCFLHEVPCQGSLPSWWGPHVGRYSSASSRCRVWSSHCIYPLANRIVSGDRWGDKLKIKFLIESPI